MNQIKKMTGETPELRSDKRKPRQIIEITEITEITEIIEIIEVIEIIEIIEKANKEKMMSPRRPQVCLEFETKSERAT